MLKRHPKVIALIVVAIALCAPAAQAQNATKADIDGLRTVLTTQIGNLTTTTTTKLNTLQTDVDAMETKLNGMDARLLGLQANYTKLLTQLGLISANVNGTRSESFEDNVQIYNALVGTDKKPILPAFSAEIDRLMAENRLLREDFNAMNESLTEGFNIANDGQEQVFAVAGQSLDKDTMQTYLLAALLISQVFLVMYVTKRPKKLWRRYLHEQAKTGQRGEYVEPPCPQEAKGWKFGEFHAGGGCPFRESCPVADACKAKANDATAADAVAGSPIAGDDEAILPTKKPVVRVVDEDEELMKGFGGGKK